jgi:hypothetical protein
MNNLIYLIIPDIHTNHTRAEEIIQREAPDHVVFLGDYFDEFGDTPDTNAKTAIWLRDSLLKSNRTHLWGNHDVSYGFIAPRAKCSGYTPQKDNAINSILDYNSWNKLKLHTWVDGILLTHAGLHPFHVPTEMSKDRDKMKQWLVEEEAFAKKMMNQNKNHWMFQAGQARGGNYPIGGIVWCDADREFENVVGLSQIFGHTPQVQPRMMFDADAHNCTQSWALDTRFLWYATIKNGKVTTIPYDKELAEDRIKRNGRIVNWSNP